MPWEFLQIALVLSDANSWLAKASGIFLGAVVGGNMTWIGYSFSLITEKRREFSLTRANYQLGADCARIAQGSDLSQVATSDSQKLLTVKPSSISHWIDNQHLFARWSLEAWINPTLNPVSF